MSILDKEYIKDYITSDLGKKVPYRWTHGATDKHLGDGLVVYSLIQLKRAKICVCLGSGGGFIPRIMTAARAELHDQGIFEGDNDKNWGDIGATYIVDAANGVGGKVTWLEQDSFLRKTFHPRIIASTTEKAYYDFFVKEDIQIDYLHIDADHSFNGVKLDFDLYSKLVPKHGIISIHDTDISYQDNYIVSKDITDQEHHDNFADGPSKFVKSLNKKKWKTFDLFNEGIHPSKPSTTGLTLIQHA